MIWGYYEMYPIGLPQLVEKGIVTNRRPIILGNHGDLLFGDKEMYKFVEQPPLVNCILLLIPTTRFYSAASQCGSNEYGFNGGFQRSDRFGG